MFVGSLLVLVLILAAVFAVLIVIFLRQRRDSGSIGADNGGAGGMSFVSGDTSNWDNATSTSWFSADTGASPDSGSSWDSGNSSCDTGDSGGFSSGDSGGSSDSGGGGSCD